PDRQGRWARLPVARDRRLLLPAELPRNSRPAIFPIRHGPRKDDGKTPCAPIAEATRTLFPGRFGHGPRDHVPRVALAARRASGTLRCLFADGGHGVLTGHGTTRALPISARPRGLSCHPLRPRARLRSRLVSIWSRPGLA